jgi:lipid-binding SYLF domain-containing protein
MKKFLTLLSIISLASFCWASAKDDSTERLQRASEVLQQMVQAPDKGIPEEVLAKAKCIAIVPHLVKGGLGFGGKHGRGVATCRTGEGWSAPAFISVGGGSWGLQIGVESVDLILLVMNDKGMEHLLSSKFQISGEGSAAAGPVGRHASAGTDWKLETEMLTYSRSKGAFAGLTLEGAVIQPDNDSTKAIYEKDVPFRAILTGKVASPDVAKPFVQSVRAAVHESKQAEK